MIKVRLMEILALKNFGYSTLVNVMMRQERIVVGLELIVATHPCVW
jgi:hypothetical protein